MIFPMLHLHFPWPCHEKVHVSELRAILAIFSLKERTVGGYPRIPPGYPPNVPRIPRGCRGRKGEAGRREEGRKEARKDRGKKEGRIEGRKEGRRK